MRASAEPDTREEHDQGADPAEEGLGEHAGAPAFLPLQGGLPGECRPPG
ncbi:hypothetical protein ACE1OA_00970 [Streptomyces sp. JL2001]